LTKNHTLRILPPKSIIVKKILINKILAYSAKKIIAKLPLLYSTLNPDTNSLSPSAKSKGDRFVSAKKIIKITNVTGIFKNIK
jgi:hypothetical protein